MQAERLIASHRDEAVVRQSYWERPVTLKPGILEVANMIAAKTATGPIVERLALSAKGPKAAFRLSGSRHRAYGNRYWVNFESASST